MLSAQTIGSNKQQRTVRRRSDETRALFAERRVEKSEIPPKKNNNPARQHRYTKAFALARRRNVTMARAHTPIVERQFGAGSDRLERNEEVVAVAVQKGRVRVARVVHVVVRLARRTHVQVFVHLRTPRNNSTQSTTTTHTHSAHSKRTHADARRHQSPQNLSAQTASKRTTDALRRT